MIVREIHAANYRSLRSIRFPTGRLTVFVGANGVGKTNLYRALQLLQASAAGTLARELAAEGGMESAFWAGKRRAGEPARIKLSVGFGEPAVEGVVYAYEVEIGVPPPGRPRRLPARAGPQGRAAAVPSPRPQPQAAGAARPDR